MHEDFYMTNKFSDEEFEKEFEKELFDEHYCYPLSHANFRETVERAIDRSKRTSEVGDAMGTLSSAEDRRMARWAEITKMDTLSLAEDRRREVWPKITKKNVGKLLSVFPIRFILEYSSISPKERRVVEEHALLGMLD
jgi:hypothetical protein